MSALHAPLPYRSAAFAQELPRAATVLSIADRVTVMSHYNPDPDALGSSCALALLLLGAGKEVTLLNQDRVIEHFSFIPGTDLVRSEPPVAAPDALVVCDCGDERRVGDKLSAWLMSQAVRINVDHHSSNSRFGTINLIDEAASSSSELVYDLACALQQADAEKFRVTNEIASALFAGIAADTGSFRYSSTTARTFTTAARLYEAGARPYAIAQELFSRQSLAALRLQARALCELELFADNRVSFVVVGEDHFRAVGALPEDAEGLAEKARDIDGVRVSAALRFVDGLWRVSMRSRDPRWNVADVAAKFGGGGHKVAAAFRSRLAINELRALLIPALIATVEEAEHA